MLISSLRKGIKLKTDDTIQCSTILIFQEGAVHLDSGDWDPVQGDLWLVQYSHTILWLVQVIPAHFQRILDMVPLVSGRDNLVITSSLDRSIKVWDLNYIFEEDHHIDKQVRGLLEFFNFDLTSNKVPSSTLISAVDNKRCKKNWRT